MGPKDPFKDIISFDGRPGNYREFRRKVKVILSVTALEDKVQHLAGPKLLSRLTGEAWRCTCRTSVNWTQQGWLRVLECLDKHYKHLPEVELHESIDDFLFHLKRKPHEGATALAPRFKIALARLHNLIAAERDASKSKRLRKDPSRLHLGPATPVQGELEDSSDAADKAPEHEAEQMDAEDDLCKTRRFATSDGSTSCSEAI